MRVNSAQTLRKKSPLPPSSSSVGMRLNVVTPLRQSESGTQCMIEGVGWSCRAGVGAGAPIMFGRVMISISRSKPSNSEGSAVSTLTGRDGGSSRTIAIVRRAWPRPW